jgi:shikimate kinase
MHRIILSGIKHSGKSTIGWQLSSRLGIFFADLDDLILRENSHYSTIRELYRDLGSEGFKEKEFLSLKHFLQLNFNKSFVLSLGGGTIENEKAVELLKGEDVTRYFLDASSDDLYSRIIQGGIPPFLEGDEPYINFMKMYTKRSESYKLWADREINTRGLEPSEVTTKIEALINE